MGISWAKWSELNIDVHDNTPGGATYVVGATPLCFAVLAGTNKAVKALTGGKSTNPDYINDEFVQQLLDDGKIDIDDTKCGNDGWWGCQVWVDGEYVGEVGERCAKRAGYGTDHPGTGRCKHHGGAGFLLGAAATITHGRKSHHMRKTLADKIQQYLQDQNLLDLSKELAVQRASLDTMVEYADSLMAEDPDQAIRLTNGLVKICGEIGRLAERVASIDQKYALTAGHVRYIQAVVVDVLTKYVPGPYQQEQAAKELVSRLGGGGDTIITTALVKGNRVLSPNP